MKKNYQTDAARAAMSEVVVPDVVSVAMSELTGAMREGCWRSRSARACR